MNLVLSAGSDSQTCFATVGEVVSVFNEHPKGNNKQAY